MTERHHEEARTAAASSTISRSTFLKMFAVGLGSAIAGCSPMRAVLNLYHSEYDDPGLRARTLHAFVVTIIPGAPADDPDLIRLFSDPDFPFVGRIGFFVADLCTRSREMFGQNRFHLLGAGERERIVRAALDDPTVGRPLYQAAILAAQVSCFGSIYDDGKGCPLLEFAGRNSGFPPELMYYSNAESYLAEAITRDGNFY